MPRASTWSCAAVALVGLALLTACGDAKDARVAATAPLTDECSSVPEGAARVTLTAPDGARLGAAVIGAPGARVGVVIEYGLSQTLCNWLDEAQRIAEADHARVIVVDRRGVASSSSARENPPLWPQDVVAGARWLTRHGTRRIVLMGSSFGSPITVVAASPTGSRYAVFPPRPRAATIAPPCAVILISPISYAEGMGGEVSAPAIREFRSLAFIAYETGNREIRQAATRLHARLLAIGAPAVHMRPIPGTDHSIGLVEKHEEARALIDEGVRSCS
jgi:pimeloyl-ACP methyl ester carboxylesterase